MISPQSDIILLKSPLEATDTNQLTFASATAQYNYFYGLPKLEIDGATYQRKDNTIRFPAEFDTVLPYNYVMYRNDAYSNKWFYAFITDIQYINDNMTSVTIKTDVFQTWQFQFQYKPCFIEREHTNDDTVGANTIPEGLETGPFIHNGNASDHIYGGFANTVTIIGVTDDSVYQPDFPAGISVIKNIYNGVSSGLTYYAIKHDSAYSHKLKEFIDGYQNATPSKIDAIYSIFEVPKSTEFLLNMLETSTDSGFFYVLGNVLPYDLSNITTSRPATVDGYTPKNNKVLTAPYNYFYVSNNAGSDVDYRYEDFSTPSSIKFKVKFAVCPGTSVKCVPTNYLGSTAEKDNYNASVTGGKLPTCSWTSDAYTNWLTQNALNIESGMIGGFLSTAIGGVSAIAGLGGLAGVSLTAGLANVMMSDNDDAKKGVGVLGGLLGGGLLGMKSGYDQMRELENQAYQHRCIPPQAKGDINSGDVTYADGKAGFTVHRMCIKAEYARCIDEYFSVYGYKTLRMKTPNITGRTNWNYVKTVSAYVEGDIPQADLTEFMGMLDKGITFWHNPTTFMDYSQSNAII